MNTLDYAIVAIYIIGLLSMGFLLRNQHSKNEYFLGARSLDWKPLSLSIMATQLSAISFISAPAFVGLREGGGLIWLSYELALPLAMLFLLWNLLPTLHRSGVVSVYDFLEKRFDRSSRLLISLVFQISRSFATGIMIYTASIILQATLAVEFWQSILLIGGITIIYSLQGGMKAVVYGDALQMLLIVFGALLCLVFGLHYVGGLQSLLDNADPLRLQAINFGSSGFDGQGFGFLPMLLGGLFLYASYYGCDQSEAQRSLSAKNTSDLKKMLLAASILRFPITLIYCFAGLTIDTFAFMTPEFLSQIPKEHPDWMMPIFIVNYMPNGIIGLLLVAIMAAAMSSLSSAINSLSAVSVEDFCRYANKSPDNQQYIRFARVAGILWGGITLIFSIFAGDIAPTVIEAINKIGSVFFGPILGIFFLGMADKRLFAIHVNFGLVSGVLLNVAFWLFVPEVFWFWWNALGFSATIIVSYLAMIVFKRDHIVGQDHIVPSKELVLNKVDLAILLGWFLVILATCIILPHLLT